MTTKSTSITNGMTITTTGNHSTVSVAEENGDVIANIGPADTTDTDFMTFLQVFPPRTAPSPITNRTTPR